MFFIIRVLFIWNAIMLSCRPIVTDHSPHTLTLKKYIQVLCLKKIQREMKILQVVFCLLQKYTSLNFLIPLKLRTFSLVVKLRSYLERRTWRFFKW